MQRNLAAERQECHMAGMSDGHLIFDRGALRRHRERAAAGFSDFDFLAREVAIRLGERLADVTRRFPRALDLGCLNGTLSRAIAGLGGIESIVRCDLSAAHIAAARRLGGGNGLDLVADEEFSPFAEASFDLVVSGLALHWVNDLPGTLAQIRRCLKPDGLFLATFLGGDTLSQLRAALVEAESEQSAGASPRVSPFADVRQAGDLLIRAGFALPVADVDSLSVSYGDALGLMRDLRGMGESNALDGRRRNFTPRKLLWRAAELYRQRYADREGRLPARFDIITITAWAPHPSQPRPARPGSATASLADALGEVGGGI